MNIKTKKIALIIILITLIILFISLLINNISKSYIDFENNKIVFEYGDRLSPEKVKNKAIHKNNYAFNDINIESDIFDIHMPEVGIYTAYAVLNGEKIQFDIIIKDTIPPVFSKFTNKTKLNLGESINYDKLFKAEDISKVTYEIKDNNLNLNEVGTYTVTIIAKDFNGNETKKDMIVEVIDEKDKDENTNTNNNGGSSNNGGSGSVAPTPTPPPVVEPEQPKPTPPPVIEPTPEPDVCVSDGNFGRIGNSGKVFYSIEEMDAWAFGFLESEANWNGPDYAGFTAWTVYDNCGERNDVWTVDFY